MMRCMAGNGSPSSCSAGRSRGQVLEGPARHLDKLPNSGNILLVSGCGYMVKSGAGRQPPTAARFPGLPEELLRTCAVIAIVGAHVARDAASRLTMPVPDGSGLEAGGWPAPYWAPLRAPVHPPSQRSTRPPGAVAEDAAADHLTPSVPAHMIGSAVIHFAAHDAGLSLT